MRSGLVILLTILGAQASYAQCDPTRFRSPCEMPFYSAPNQSLSQVYCGDRLGYISWADYERLRRYQRVHTNMILTINGEYVDSPCIPAGKHW